MSETFILLEMELLFDIAESHLPRKHITSLDSIGTATDQRILMVVEVFRAMLWCANQLCLGFFPGTYKQVQGGIALAPV